MQPASSQIYTLSLHDALPILALACEPRVRRAAVRRAGLEHQLRVHVAPHGEALALAPQAQLDQVERRSEEHTSELQSRRDLVCRLLLEKKKTLRIRVYFTSRI